MKRTLFLVVTLFMLLTSHAQRQETTVSVPQYFNLHWLITHPGGYFTSNHISKTDFIKKASTVPLPGLKEKIYKSVSQSKNYPTHVDVVFYNNQNLISSYDILFTARKIECGIIFEEDSNNISMVNYTIEFGSESRAKDLVKKWKKELQKSRFARKLYKDSYNCSWGRYRDYTFQSCNVEAPVFIKANAGRNLVSLSVFYNH